MSLTDTQVYIEGCPSSECPLEVPWYAYNWDFGYSDPIYFGNGLCCSVATPVIPPMGRLLNTVLIHCIWTVHCIVTAIAATSRAEQFHS